MDTPGVKFNPDIDYKALYKGVNGAIIMFDITNTESYKNVKYWYDGILQYCSKEIPIILCGNKADYCRYERPCAITPKSVPYYEISTKSNYNVEQPLLRLLRTLTSNESLCIRVPDTIKWFK